MRPRMRELAYLFLVPLLLAAGQGGDRSSAPPRPWIATGDGAVISSSGSGALSKAAGDSFLLFGGPDSVEGKFETADGNPDRQGWIGVDLTERIPKWQRSTFNAENLNSNGPGNNAMWCGQTAAQQPGWATPPGYGNSWFEALAFESDLLVDPSIAQTVELDFYFNHELEPAYDYFLVQYDSAGAWTTVLEVSQSNKEVNGSFPAPGVQPQSHPSWRPITYSGDDHGWAGAEPRIRIRMVVASDGAFSDQDALWPTDAGAAQVDDIRVRYDDGTGNVVEVFEGFESMGPYAWEPFRAPFVGDFSKVFAKFDDIDPCRSNGSPVMTFIDDGTPPSNAPAPDGTMSTGGETSFLWDYGVPGGWVVNNHGGLSNNQFDLYNEVWSPPIAWDFPGPADDDPTMVGAELRYDVWPHLPLLNGDVYVWSVRSSTDGGTSWSDWRDRDFVYASSRTSWWSRQHDVTDLLELDPTHVQIALGVREIEPFFPSDDSTPAPVFDNVSLVKHDVGGPVIWARDIDLAQGGFPPSGSIDASTPAGRDALDVPFDGARDEDSGDTIVVPIDVVYFQTDTIIPGTAVVDVRMHWRLEKNPLFEDAIRSAPARPGLDENVDTSDPLVWSGEVVATSTPPPVSSTDSDGWFADLPDEDFLYPGDVLKYYFAATDDDGRTTTLPNDLRGFEPSLFPYDQRFVVRALPSIRNAGGDQPRFLWLNQSGHGSESVRLQRGILELGFAAGWDYDVYTPRSVGSGLSTGIGTPGAHGATVEQLAGYQTILVSAARLSFVVLSDGSNNGLNDLSDDIGLLTDWKNLPGERNTLYFGDNIASAPTNGGAAGAAYVAGIMGVTVNGSDVGASIADQEIPVVRPTSPSFAQTFAAYGWCPSFNGFDDISPAGAAYTSHVFIDRADQPIAGPSAAVIHDRFVDGFRKVDITFPYGTASAWQERESRGSGTIVLSDVLREVLDYFGVPSSGGGVVGTPAEASRMALSAAPNPFNPSTSIAYTLPVDGHVQLRVHDVRGLLVRVLVDEVKERGAYTARWDGRDDRGARVASGTYLVELRTPAGKLARKLALLK